MVNHIYPRRSQVMKFDWKLTTEVHARVPVKRCPMCVQNIEGVCLLRIWILFCTRSHFADTAYIDTNIQSLNFSLISIQRTNYILFSLSQMVTFFSYFFFLWLISWEGGGVFGCKEKIIQCIKKCVVEIYFNQICRIFENFTPLAKASWEFSAVLAC